MDRDAILSNFANARVYQDFKGYIDETFKTVDNKLIGANSDVLASGWNIKIDSQQQVVYKEGDFIVYLTDENGSRDFYYYDKLSGSISLYRFADKKAEILYSYLFDVFLVIAIIEAVIITITVYIVRRMVSERTNPRPKRV